MQSFVFNDEQQKIVDRWLAGDSIRGEAHHELVAAGFPDDLAEAYLESTQVRKEHFVSTSCEGEFCRVCGEAATHKLGEEIPFDDPSGASIRHNFTAYVCCGHFILIVGSHVRRQTHCPVFMQSTTRTIEVLLAKVEQLTEKKT